MEQKLLELFPDETVTLQDYKSFLFQPERIQISSKDDSSVDFDPSAYVIDGQLFSTRSLGPLTSFYKFSVKLPRPALKVKTLQLARANVPNPGINIPDSETTFWFYALPKVSSGTIFANNAGAPGAAVYTFDSSGNIYSAGNIVPNAYVFFDVGKFVTGFGTGGVQNYLFDVPTASTGAVTQVLTDASPPVLSYFIEYDDPTVGEPRIEYLRFVRLIPSWAQLELLEDNVGNFFSGGVNRYFSDYQDLVDELNKSCQDDFLNGFAPVTDNEFGFKWVANLIQFDFSATSNKISFTGLDQNFSYLPVAADDPTWKLAASQLYTLDRLNATFNWPVNLSLRLFQPYGERNLNLRTGFTYATYSADPFPPGLSPYSYRETATRPFPAQTNPVPTYSLFTHVAPGYADLVFSSCCNIYCDIVGGSTVDSTTNRSLLASIPMNTPPLGVGFHSLPLNNPLTKVVSEIYQIQIELRTDTGEPFYLGNNAIVSLELILTY